MAVGISPCWRAASALDTREAKVSAVCGRAGRDRTPALIRMRRHTLQTKRTALGEAIAGWMPSELANLTLSPHTLYSTQETTFNHLDVLEIQTFVRQFDTAARLSCALPEYTSPCLL